MAADAILSALEAKRFKPGAFALLREVRNRTGYHGRQRYADALAVSCWPSRGLSFSGIEVKISRSDWQREIAEPEKSAEIQRFCHYWWIATPPGIVREGELPETWGLFEVDGKKVMAVREAPRLEPDPPSIGFVCSVFRNQSKGLERMLQHATTEGYVRAREEFDGDAVAEIRSKMFAAELECDQLKRKLERLESTVAAFERAAGVQIDRWNPSSTAALLKAAEGLRGYDLDRVADQLALAAKAVRDAAETVAEEQHAARGGSAVPEVPS